MPTPASQTLIVLSHEPLSWMSPDALTMVFPFGEKATDSTGQSWALFFSPLSSREAVASVGALSFGLGEEYGGLRYLHPRL